MNMFFDFDGTIVENSQRYWRVHEEAIRASRSGGSQTSASKGLLAKQKYWLLKRDHIPEHDIVQTHYPSIDAEAYLKRRGELIEDPKFLRFDSLFPDTLKTLTELKQAGHDLYLVSLRRNEKNFFWEVDFHNLRPFFTEILTAIPSDQPWETKAGLIRPFAKPDDWIIGDTEADVRAGRMLKLSTCAVTSGIRTEEYLKTLKPTVVVQSLDKLQAIHHLRS